MSKDLKSKKIALTTRKRILQCYIWSTLQYGVETWTITENMAKILLKYFGHIIRQNGNTLHRTVLDGKVNGSRSRGRGRPRTKWTSNITKWTGLEYHQAADRHNTAKNGGPLHPTLGKRMEHDDDDDGMLKLTHHILR